MNGFIFRSNIIIVAEGAIDRDGNDIKSDDIKKVSSLYSSDVDRDWLYPDPDPDPQS